MHSDFRGEVCVSTNGKSHTDYLQCMYQAEVDVHFPQLTVRPS